jgi:hypothetical protein
MLQTIQLILWKTRIPLQLFLYHSGHNLLQDQETRVPFDPTAIYNLLVSTSAVINGDSEGEEEYTQ